MVLLFSPLFFSTPNDLELGTVEAPPTLQWAHLPSVTVGWNYSAKHEIRARSRFFFFAFAFTMFKETHRLASHGGRVGLVCDDVLLIDSSGEKCLTKQYPICFSARTHAHTHSFNMEYFSNNGATIYQCDSKQSSEKCASRTLGSRVVLLAHCNTIKIANRG